MKIETLKKKHEQLKRSLLSLGPVLQGSILPRIIQRQDPQRPNQTKDYGPYYQWTRKIAGKTAIQNLSPAQAKVYGKAIQQNRKLEKIVAEMRETSLRMLELTTEGVPKRKSGKKEGSPLS